MSCCPVLGPTANKQLSAVVGKVQELFPANAMSGPVEAGWTAEIEGTYPYVNLVSLALQMRKLAVDCFEHIA